MSTPANGVAFVGLLIGGNEDVLRTLRGDLYDEFGIEVRNQWQFVREFCPTPPRDTDVVLILTDFCAHGMSRDAVRLAKANKIRYALIGRKKSAWLNGLNTCGFIHHPSWLQPKRKDPAPMETPKPTPAPNNGALPTKPFSALAGITYPSVGAPTREVAPSLESVLMIPMPRRWTEQDMATVGRLSEAFKPTNPPGSLLADGERFVMQVWKETGEFRTASVLRLRIDAIRFVIKVPPALVMALSRASAHVRRAKAVYIKAEAEVVKKKPRAEWPPWLSNDTATALVGIASRIEATPMMMRSLGMIVYRREDVVKVLTTFEERGITAAWRGTGMTPLEWERRVLTELKEKGPSARGVFKLSSARNGSIGIDVIESLLRSGRILSGKGHGGVIYRLPEHAWPPPPRTYAPRTPVVPAVPETAPAPVAAPSVDTQRELRADVYRAMRAGEINAKDAAELLRQLAKGA